MIHWNIVYTALSLSTNREHNYICCSVLCILMVERSEFYVVSDECDERTPCLVRAIGAHGGEVMYLGSVYFRGELVS